MTPNLESTLLDKVLMAAIMVSMSRFGAAWTNGRFRGGSHGKTADKMVSATVLSARHCSTTGATKIRNHISERPTANRPQPKYGRFPKLAGKEATTAGG